MTITLDPIKHTGAAPEPIVLLAEAEQLTFIGATLTDNMAATILSPTGTALASGLIAGNAVTLDTRTSQAWDYISAQACGVTAPALLAIGDADVLVAVMPVRVLRNNLYNLAPPSETVTVYPSMAELREILAQIAAADASAEDLVTRAEALGVSITAFEQALPGMISGAETEIDGAKNVAVEAVGNAQTGAVNAVTNAQTAAVQAVQNKATEVSGEFDGKVTAAQNAATEARGHATAAVNSASAASQSASAAAGSATAAGQSAEAVEAIKTELQDALTEASGVAGRVTGLEAGKGVYKDPATGKVFYFDPIPESDGTLAIIKYNGCFYQVGVMESLASSAGLGKYDYCASDGEYLFFYCRDAGSVWTLYIYDSDLRRVAKIGNKQWNTPNIQSALNFPVCKDANGNAYAWVAEFYAKTKWNIYSLADGSLVTSLTLPANSYAVYNKQSGNVVVYNTSSQTYSRYTPEGVLIESGLPLAETLPACSYIYQSSPFTMITTSSRLFIVNADDTITAVNYHTATVDANGYVDLMRDESGEPIRMDWDCSFKYNPITTEVGTIPFSANVTRGNTVYTTQPIFLSVWGYGDSMTHLVTNGINFYWLFPDGRVIESNSLGTVYGATVITVSQSGKTVKPVSVPNTTLSLTSSDALLPCGANYNAEGRPDDSVFLAQMKGTVPSGNVFATTEANANLATTSDGIPQTGRQLPIHYAFGNARVSFASISNRSYGFFGKPIHFARKDFS